MSKGTNVFIALMVCAAAGCATPGPAGAPQGTPANGVRAGTTPLSELVVPVPGVAFEEEKELASATEDVAGKSGGTSASDLAKKTQNPVADLVTIPFQYNALTNVGHKRRTAHVLNIQPVIPFHLNEEWNLVTRTILPVIDQPELVPGYGEESGLGDLDFTAFFSPAKSEGWIWGLGPTVSLPTATDDELGSERWGLGPSAVVLKMDGPWVYGALAKNQWDVGGDGDRERINRGLVQPFLNYNMADGWYLSSAPIITADWRARSGERWTVPLGGGFGRLFMVGEQPVNAGIQAYYNVRHPDLAGNWSLRVVIQLLF